MIFNAAAHATFAGIAEGNPDEDKIGAFGVGMLSVVNYRIYRVTNC